MRLPATPQTILILAPHTDDGELGAGGSLARWISEGHRVHYLAFSACETSVPEGWPEDTLRREVAAATGVLGIPSDQLRVLDYRVRQFGAERQRILQEMVDVGNELAPDLVLLPSLNDLHQDHWVIAQEGARAFKRTSMLAYEIPWNNVSFEASGFVALDEEHVQKKIDALSCYESQSARSYIDGEYLRAQARFRGIQAGVEYAESFEVKKWFL